MKRTPLQRKTPMRACSPMAGAKTTKRKAARYTGPSPALRKQVLERDDYACQRCGRTIDGRPYSLQHRDPRGMGGSRRVDRNTLANLVTVCGSATTPDSCHDWMEHQARNRATREGWLVPTGIAPEAWPVLRFGQLWSMPGESWTEVEPNPMQVPTEEAA